MDAATDGPTRTIRCHDPRDSDSAEPGNQIYSSSTPARHGVAQHDPLSYAKVPLVQAAQPSTVVGDSRAAERPSDSPCQCQGPTGEPETAPGRHGARSWWRAQVTPRRDTAGAVTVDSEVDTAMRLHKPCGGCQWVPRHDWQARRARRLRSRIVTAVLASVPHAQPGRPGGVGMGPARGPTFFFSGTAILRIRVRATSSAPVLSQTVAKIAQCKRILQSEKRPRSLCRPFVWTQVWQQFPSPMTRWHIR